MKHHLGAAPLSKARPKMKGDEGEATWSFLPRECSAMFRGAPRKRLLKVLRKPPRCGFELGALGFESELLLLLHVGLAMLGDYQPVPVSSLFAQGPSTTQNTGVTGSRECPFTRLSRQFVQDSKAADTRLPWCQRISDCDNVERQGHIVYQAPFHTSCSFRMLVRLDGVKFAASHPSAQPQIYILLWQHSHLLPRSK